MVIHDCTYTHTYAHKYTCACMTPSTRWSTDTETHNLCTNMRTHTHTHMHKRLRIHTHTHIHICINAYVYIHIHTCIYIHIYMSAHIHTYTYMQTHLQNVHMKRTQERLERLRVSERARSRCRPRKLYTSLSFDAIKPHFAPPIQGLHFTHVLQHQYPSIPHPLLPTNPRTVCGRGQAQFHCHMSTLIRWTEYIALKKLHAVSQWPFV